MAKPEWGTKRICPSCGARYYDLRKEPPICPTCNAPFDPEALLKSRRARPAPVDEPKKSPVRADEEGNEVEVEEDVADLEEAGEDGGIAVIEGEADEAAEDDVLIEDTSELGEDDMDEVVDMENADEEER